MRGFRSSLIAGEEPELCLRLRKQGWKIWRLDAEMTEQDAAMKRFQQWCIRTVRIETGPPQNDWDELCSSDGQRNGREEAAC